MLLNMKEINFALKLTRKENPQKSYALHEFILKFCSNNLNFF